MRLNELFNDIYDYNDLEEVDGDWVATFTTSAARAKDRRDVSVAFDLVQFWHSPAVLTDIYELEFDVDGAYNITGGGDAIKIFGTVLAIVRDFIKHVQPNAIIFDAKDESRNKLYARMTKRICSSGGYVNATAELDERIKKEVPPVGAKAPILDQLTYFYKRYRDNTLDGYETTILVKNSVLK